MYAIQKNKRKKVSTTNSGPGKPVRTITDPLEKDMQANPGRPFPIGQYVLSELLLGRIVSDGGPGANFTDVADLTSPANRFETFTLQQSIDLPTITLTITISDVGAVLERINKHGLSGEEFVKIKLNSPERSQRQAIDLLFHVRDVSTITPDAKRAGTKYTIFCSTKELLVSNLENINKYFAKTESEIAETIFKRNITDSPTSRILKQANGGGFTLWKERKFEVDESYGSPGKIIPGLTPIDACLRMASGAWGGPYYKGSAYRFFENVDGFHFANIEYRLQQTKREGANFNIDPLTISEPPKTIASYRNVKTQRPLTITSAHDRIINGTYSNSVRTIDYMRKKTIDTHMSIDKTYNQYSHTNNLQNFSKSFFETFGKKNPFQYTVTKDSIQGNNIDKVAGHQRAYLDLLSSYRTIIDVYGDVTLKPGECIGLNVTEASPQSEDTSIFSGTWFISSVTHVVDGSEMITSLGLSKSGIQQKHNNTKTSY